MNALPALPLSPAGVPAAGGGEGGMGRQHAEVDVSQLTAAAYLAADAADKLAAAVAAAGGRRAGGGVG
eukprot:364999-Chlamydomonas_euryale.AAC.1